MIKQAILGLAVGDALGVPVEFQSREQLRQHPVREMRAYGTYHQPKGTWSDDSSLTFCLMEALSQGFELKTIAEKFVDWKSQAYWTAHGKVFDIGVTTSLAINKLENILAIKDYEGLAFLYLEAREDMNGNGSLMRILPLFFYLKNKGFEHNFDTIWQVSALTHGHIRAALCCLFYLIMAEEIVSHKDKSIAYANTQKRFQTFLENGNMNLKERQLFDRLVTQNIFDFAEQDIQSSGYVIHSLEAAMWCLMTNNDYKSTVLAAVNLGIDTDTTAAIVGGLAGLLYGYEAIPKDWINCLARLEDILELCERLELTLMS